MERRAQIKHCKKKLFLYFKFEEFVTVGFNHPCYSFNCHLSDVKIQCDDLVISNALPT